MTPLSPATVWTPALDDYARFHAHAVATSDVDPVYPVLDLVGSLLDCTPDDTVWLGLLHVAYYDLGSALTVFDAHRQPAVPADHLLRLPCATERRGHRAPAQLAAHLRSLVARAEAWGGLARWMHEAVLTQHPPDAVYGWGNALLRSVYGNGRWAGYKACELLAHIMARHDPAWAHLTPTDMGHAHSTGPRHGLGLLVDGLPAGNTAGDVAVLDRVSRQLVRELHRRDLRATAATAETTLCDFHALVEGRYYVGHDIDQMQAQLAAARPGPAVAAAWQARAAVLPSAYLGERHGWTGPDPARRRRYRDDREMVTRP